MIRFVSILLFIVLYMPLTAEAAFQYPVPVLNISLMPGATHRLREGEFKPSPRRSEHTVLRRALPSTSIRKREAFLQRRPVAALHAAADENPCEGLRGLEGADCRKEVRIQKELEMRRKRTPEIDQEKVYIIQDAVPEYTRKHNDEPRIRKSVEWWQE